VDAILDFCNKTALKVQRQPTVELSCLVTFGRREFCFLLGWQRELQALLNMCLLLLLFVVATPYKLYGMLQCHLLFCVHKVMMLLHTFDFHSRWNMFCWCQFCLAQMFGSL